MCRGEADAACDRCHVYANQNGVGMVCTLRKGHGGTRHLDVFHNRSFPIVRSNTPERESKA
jgi:hypothetical protein